MSDIVKDATFYRIKQIELAEAEYYKSLITALDRIEREVVSLASGLPLTDGKLIELQSAIAIRPQIKAILEKEYLKSPFFISEEHWEFVNELTMNYRIQNRIPLTK